MEGSDVRFGRGHSRTGYLLGSKINTNKWLQSQGPQRATVRHVGHEGRQGPFTLRLRHVKGLSAWEARPSGLR